MDAIGINSKVSMAAKGASLVLPPRYLSADRDPRKKLVVVAIAPV
jgi:hypothetical protein